MKDKEVEVPTQAVFYHYLPCTVHGNSHNPLRTKGNSITSPMRPQRSREAVTQQEGSGDEQKNTQGQQLSTKTTGGSVPSLTDLLEPFWATPKDQKAMIPAI